MATPSVESSSAAELEIDALTREEQVVAPHVVSLDEVKLLKFPRTPHIMNLGAPKLKRTVDASSTLTIEEKMDGANMGISIDLLSGRILVQHRNHYISSNYHPQFQPLGAWLRTHSAELYSVLVPGRHVLYGEWLYATHSVYYNNLPDYFIAYDLFDRVENVFYSRERLVHTLASTSIAVSPLLFEGPVQSCDEVLALVHGRSALFDAEATDATHSGRREGIVVRICDKDRLVSRAKLVREDFVAYKARSNKTGKLDKNTIGLESVVNRMSAK